MDEEINQNVYSRIISGDVKISVNRDIADNRCTPLAKDLLCSDCGYRQRDECTLKTAVHRIVKPKCRGGMVFLLDVAGKINGMFDTENRMSVEKTLTDEIMREQERLAGTSTTDMREFLKFVEEDMSRKADDGDDPGEGDAGKDVKA